MDTSTADRAVFSTVRAYPQTRAAMHAFLSRYQQLRLKRLTFRILAPCTSQWTAFQKNRRPHAWPVVHAEFTHFKYNADCILCRHSSSKQHMEGFRHLAICDDIIDRRHDARQDRSEDFTRDKSHHKRSCFVINACATVFND